jgi:hypothetical protein
LAVDLSAAARALGLGGAAESEADRKKRLAALQNAQQAAQRSLGDNFSPAAASYLSMGGLRLGATGL